MSAPKRPHGDLRSATHEASRGPAPGGPRVIVTRPAAQAAGWVERLRARGVEAIALPLIAIAPAADPQALAAAWSALPSRRLVVFVSPNAAERFFAARPEGAAWPADVVAATPGPGTADTLRTLGVPAAGVVEPAAEAAQFDSVSLWCRLQSHDWRGASVLIVRGDGGRDWLGDRLVEAGARVDHLAAYRRRPPAWSAADRALIAASQAAPRDHVWLFSSSQAIDHLEQAAGAAGWGASVAVATHERIAARARRAGFATVAEARPSVDAVVACIQSFGP